MAKKTENDGGSRPTAPSVAEMRANQAKGATGIGHNEQSYNDSLKDFNQGVGINGDMTEGYDINQRCQPGEDDCPQ
jgi:hypothetical protein